MTKHANDSRLFEDENITEVFRVTNIKNGFVQCIYPPKPWPPYFTDKPHLAPLKRHVEVIDNG